MLRPVACLMVFAVSWATGPSRGAGEINHARPASLLPSASWTSALTIPAETEAPVEILSGIHTLVSRVDDRVVARLTRPVMVDGKVALPTGTLLDGRITRIRPAGRMHRSALLGLRFEQVTLPDGDVEPVRAVLSHLDDAGGFKFHVDSEGYLKATPRSGWKAWVGGTAATGVFVTARAATAGAGALWTALPAGGAAWLAYQFLWHRGSEVVVPPESSGRVRLDYPLTVRVPW